MLCWSPPWLHLSKPRTTWTSRGRAPKSGLLVLPLRVHYGILNLDREDVYGTLNEARVIAYAAFSKPKLLLLAGN
jgi:hypothetical protein